MMVIRTACVVSLVSLVTATVASTPAAAQQQQKPNIVVIMGDDIGMWNIGAYHRGHDGGADPEHRQDRQGRHAVHRLLCRGKLHGGSR